MIEGGVLRRRRRGEGVVGWEGVLSPGRMYVRREGGLAFFQLT